MEDSQSDSSTTTIMDLPDDCLVFIFKLLDEKRYRDAFGLTCTKWLHIQNRYRLSLQFDCSFSCCLDKLSTTPHKIGTHELQKALTRFQHLRSLSLCGCTELRDPSLKLLQSFGSRLRALYLDCCFGITDEGLSSVASGCPLLIYISLYRCNITDLGLEILAMSCLNLEDVNLTHCVFISDDGINHLVQKCPRIYGIKINECRAITGVGFHGCSRTLSFLEAESCKLEHKGIASMVSGGGLEYLNISNLGSIYRAEFSVIGGGLGKTLKILNMRLCTTSDEDIEAISRGCPCLVEWNLSLCHEIRVPGWESIALNCQNLERLYVNRCRNFCDIGLEALKNGCKKLSSLYMNGCPRISSLGVELFRLLRGDIIKNEEHSINPNWQFRWEQRIFEE